MIYLILFVLFLAGAFLIFLANLEGKFTVKSTHVYDENIETVFNKLRDFKTWRDWNPWLIHEPDCKLEFSDNPSEQGGYYTWNGNIVGQGKLTHTNFQSPNTIAQKLEILKPFKSSSDIRFELLEKSGKTEVQWIMNGEMPFLFRFMVPKMKQMIAQDYKLGLAMLAGALNPNSEHPKIQFNGEVTPNDQMYLCKSFEGGLSSMEKAMQEGFPELLNFIQQNNGTINAEPRTFYHKADIKKMYFICDMAIPIDKEITSGDYSLKTLGAGKHYEIDVFGSYQFLESAWYAAMSHIYMLKLKVDNSRPSVEVYLNDPNEVEDSNQLKTRLLIPVK